MNRPPDIFEALPHLPADQLQRIKDQVSILLAIGGPKGKAKARAEAAAAPGSGEEFAKELYGVIAEELRRRMRVKSMPFSVFAGSNQFETHFRAAAAAAFQVNLQWFPKQTRLERVSMLRLYAGLVLDQLHEQSRPAVWYNIAAALNTLPQVVDRAFPGYAAAGLLGKVQTLRIRGV